MDTPNGAGRALALAALTLVSAAAGFFTINVSDSPPPDPVGTIDRTDRAYALNLETGNTLTFTRVPDVGSGPVHLVAYDPDDRYHDSFQITTDTPQPFTADATGEWVFVPWTHTGDTIEVHIQQPEPQATGSRSLSNLPLQVATETVIERLHGTAQATYGFNLDRRPALAYLTLDGNAENVTMSLDSPTGPVFDQTAKTMAGDGIEPAAGGQATLHAGRLVPGAYRLDVDVENLQGRIVLAHASYTRTPQPHALANASLPGLQAQGVPIAAATENDAFRIHSGPAEELRFVAAHDTLAQAIVYSSTHNVTNVIQLGPSNEATFDWDQDQENATLETSTIPINRNETYTVWVRSLTGHGDQLYALIPDARTADPAEPVPVLKTTIPLTRSSVELEGTSQERIHIDGGLLDVQLWINDTASQDRRVQVAGPNGVIFDHRQETTVNGTGMNPHTNERFTHFSAGTFRIDVSSGQRIDGEMTIRFHHYAP